MLREVTPAFYGKLGHLCGQLRDFTIECGLGVEQSARLVVEHQVSVEQRPHVDAQELRR